MTDLDHLTDTIAAVFESDREGTPAEPLNVVDAIFALSRSLKWLGTGDAATTMGALEYHGAMVKEASERITEGLESLATAINNLAVAIEERRR